MSGSTWGSQMQEEVRTQAKVCVHVWMFIPVTASCLGGGITDEASSGSSSGRVGKWGPRSTTLSWGPPYSLSSPAPPASVAYKN